MFQYILIRGKASLRILYFYLQVFHENDFWGELASFPSLILVVQMVPMGEFVGLMEELGLMALEGEIGFSQQLKLVAKGCICPHTRSLWSAHGWPRI